MTRRSRPLPLPRSRAIAVLAILFALPACTLWRGSARVGPLVEQEFTVATADATSADVHVAFWGGKIAIKPCAAAPRDGGSRSGGAEPLLALVARDNLDEVEPRCVTRREGQNVSARLWVDTEKKLSFDDAAQNEWELALGRRVPLDLVLGLAACEGQAELGGLALRRARVTLAAGSASLAFSRPNPTVLEELKIEMGAGKFTVSGLGNARARSIDVEAAAGAFEIDCGGEWTASALLRLATGMAGVTIRVPRELAVRVDASATTFGDVNAPDFVDEGDGRYRCAGAEVGGPGLGPELVPELVIEIEASFGTVTIVRE